MVFWEIIKGNTVVQEIAIKDGDGNFVSDLADTTAIKFQIKQSKDGSVLVEKTKTDGIEIDTPETGYLRLTLTSTDTDQDPGNYYMGLQLEWAPDIVREVILKKGGEGSNQIKIKQDIVNS